MSPLASSRARLNVRSRLLPQPQADRERALGQFKSKERPLMVATDVAARGLDIPDVEYVINYSFPLTIGEQPCTRYQIGRMTV